MSEIRTPSSLKWLIDKRARLVGRISKLEKVNAQTIERLCSRITKLEQALIDARQELAHEKSVIPALLESLKADLRALDRSMSMHDIEIDPAIIPSINTQEAPRFIHHGDITRHIYKYLTQQKSRSASSLEVAVYIATHFSLQLTDQEFLTFKIKIRHRLKDLMHQGRLIRLPTPRRAHSVWALPTDPDAPKPKWLATEFQKGD